MMIHASHQDEITEITAAAQCSLNTVKTTRYELENSDGDYKAVAGIKQHNGDLIVMETTRLWLEESNITDDLIVMETTRLWLE